MRITIENLPPIASGSFELRPLTIFIGPNNTGKSRAATAVYALSRSLRDRFWMVPNVASGFDAFVRSAYAAALDDSLPISLENLSSDSIARLQGALDLHFSQVRSSVEWALRWYLGGINSGLEATDPLGSRITVSEHTSGLEILYGKASLLEFEIIPSLELGQLRPTFASSFFDGGTDEAVEGIRAQSVWSALVDSIGIPTGSSIYLPAGRSGFLASWPLLSSIAVGLLRGGLGQVSFEFPRLEGTSGDFLQSILRVAASPATWQQQSSIPSLDLLERSILRGKIDLRSVSSGVPALEFVTESLRLPVEHASSMISELAGIVIALHESRPGSLIVVDEPEAHLHPENQRVMAQVLVRLAAAGVTVIAPTHSSNIMYEVGNLARASLLSAEDREEFGLEESDRLTPDNIGVYFFRPSEHGVNIEEIPFDPGHGYTEESFIEVAEALGDESYWLDTKLQPASR